MLRDGCAPCEMRSRAARLRVKFANRKRHLRRVGATRQSLRSALFDCRHGRSAARPWPAACDRLFPLPSRDRIRQPQTASRLGRRLSRDRQQRLPGRPRPQPGELCATDAADVSRAGGLCLSGQAVGGAWRRALHLARDLCPLPPPRLRAGAARHRQERHRRDHGPEHAADVRSGVRRADVRRRDEPAEHPARCRDHRLHAAPRRRARADHRSRVLPGDRQGAGLARRRSRWSSTSTIPLCQDGELLGETTYEAFLAEGDPEYAWQTAGRRVGCDRAELHLRHHRRSEGRGLSPSRRASERGEQHPQLGHAASRGVSLDAADVPLQRLVLPVDRRRARRRERLPAPDRGEGGVDAIRDARRDAYVRRADRVFDADQRAGGTARRGRASASPARSPAPRRPPPSSKARRRSASN